MSSDALHKSLESTLSKCAGSRSVELFVSVDEQAFGADHRVLLVAVGASGEKVLHREFELSRGDCANSAPLLQTVLERFVATLPLEEWTLDNPKEFVPTPSELFGDRPLQLGLCLKLERGVAVVSEIRAGRCAEGREGQRRVEGAR